MDVVGKAGPGEDCTGVALWNQDFFLFLKSNQRSGRYLFIFYLTLLDLQSLAIRHVIAMNKMVEVAELIRLILYQYAPEFSQLDSSLLIARLIKLLQELSE